MYKIFLQYILNKLNIVNLHKNIGFLAIFSILIIDISFRIGIEIFTLESFTPYGQINNDMCSIQGENYYIFIYYYLFYLENISYFLILFMLLISTVYFLVNYKIEKFKLIQIEKKSIIDIIKTSLIFYPLIIIPPLIDYFILGRRYGYDYGNSDNYLTGLLTLTWQGYDGKGISTLVTLGVITTTIYVYFHTKSFLKSIIAFILTDLIIVSMSMPNLFFGPSKDNFFNPLFLPYYYFIPLFISSLIFASVLKLKINFKPIIYTLPIFFISSYFLYHYQVHFMENLTKEIFELSLNKLKLFYIFNGFFIYICTLYFYLFIYYMNKKSFNLINFIMLFYINMIIVYFDVTSLDLSAGISLILIFVGYLINFFLSNRIKNV